MNTVRRTAWSSTATTCSGYGLFVEHYQKENTLWNGERGRTIFYQNELPYDVPNQAAWQNGTRRGYAAYQVADAVTTHELWGGGVYSFFSLSGVNCSPYSLVSCRAALPREGRVLQVGLRRLGGLGVPVHAAFGLEAGDGELGISRGKPSPYSLVSWPTRPAREKPLRLRYDSADLYAFC